MPTPAIPPTITALASQVFGTSVIPTDTGAVQKAIAGSALGAADKAELLKWAQELPKLTPTQRQMTGSSAALSRLTGRAPAVVGPPPSPDKRAELGKKLQEAFEGQLSGKSLPSDFGELPELWRKDKSDRTARLWAARPEMIRQAVGGAYWTADDNVGYVARGLRQNLDVGAWENFLSRQGIVDLDDNWLRLVELVSFYLEIGRDDPNVEDEHLDGGLLLQKGQFGALSGLSREEREKMGALLACSGPHMYKDEGISEYPEGISRSKVLVDLEKEPQKAKDKIRGRHHAALSWLDDANELAQFKDALLLVKLADWSRGGAHGKSDLSRAHPFTSDWCRKVLDSRGRG